MEEGSSACWFKNIRTIVLVVQEIGDSQYAKKTQPNEAVLINNVYTEIENYMLLF